MYKNINQYNDDNIKLYYKEIYDKKKKRISRYKSIRKKQSIIGELLLKNLLKKEVNINYDNIQFITNKYGKPYIKNSNIFFNISHSNDYVISVISETEIGIDIEKIKTVPIKHINQFATENEKKYILEGDNIMEKLWSIYTLKEAYFKMKGTNLNNILKVEFKIDNDNVYCSDKSIIAKLINEIEGYKVAYCEKKEIN